MNKKIETFISEADINEQLILDEIVTIDNDIEVKVKLVFFDKDSKSIGTFQDTVKILDERVQFRFIISEITQDKKIEHKYIKKVTAYIDIDDDGVLEKSESTTIQIKPKNMKLSKSGVDLLKGIEVLRLKVYDDETSKDILSNLDRYEGTATIGYGHLLKRKDGDFEKYKPLVGIKEEDAEELLLSDLEEFEIAVNEHVNVNLLEQEFDALVLLAFNIGPTAFRNSSALKLINNPKDTDSNYKTLMEAWLAFNKDNGKVSNGLVNRRNSEWKIFDKGEYKRW